MNRLVSVLVSTPFGSEAKKLGQPVPLSYLVLASNSGKLQAAQMNFPGRFSCSSALLPGYSVPSSNRMWNWSSVSSLRHYSLVLTSFALACAAKEDSGLAKAATAIAARPWRINSRRFILESSSHWRIADEGILDLHGALDCG